jgi:hypothetical protein
MEEFKSILPRLDNRRALLNVAGSFFKILFGTATVADLEQLHNTTLQMNYMQDRKNLVNSVNTQTTYKTELDFSIKFNMEAISTLSEKVKQVMLDSQKWAH